HVAHRLLVEREQVGAGELDRAGDDEAGWIGHEPHERERGDALAAARLADDRQRLAGPERKVDAVDRLHGAAAGAERGLQPLDGQQRRARPCILRRRRRARPLLARGDAHRPIVPQWRRRGSRMSRSASPSRLVPNTARLMATPGKITSQGAVRTYSAADSDSMRPHDGCGSGMPRPGNESEESVRMAGPSWAVASTISGASVLGSTWRTAMRNSLMPTARAASTYGISRSASVLERMTRAE